MCILYFISTFLKAASYGSKTAQNFIIDHCLKKQQHYCTVSFLFIELFVLLMFIFYCIQSIMFSWSITTDISKYPGVHAHPCIPSTAQCSTIQCYYNVVCEHTARLYGQLAAGVRLCVSVVRWGELIQHSSACSLLNVSTQLIPALMRASLASSHITLTLSLSLSGV